jgi:hypothetical protein
MDLRITFAKTGHFGYMFKYEQDVGSMGQVVHKPDVLDHIGILCESCSEKSLRGLIGSVSGPG